MNYQIPASAGRPRTLGVKRRSILGLTFALAIGVGSNAKARAEVTPADAIERLNDALLRIMHDGRAVPFEKRFQTLASVIDQTFDLPAVLQESVGPTWSTLPADQQAMLRDAFRRYTIASYVNSFDEFSGQRFTVDPETRSLPNGEQIVGTRIIPRSGGGHALDYVMRKTDDGWRVVDVLADGTVSRVAVQRSDFRRLLTRGGPSALADSLRSKSADLSDGAA